MNKPSAVCLLFSFLSCTLSGHYSQAQTDDDYKAEIMQHIVDPCFQYSASKSELIDQMSEEEVVMLMKLMSPNQMQETIDVTLPMVQDKPEDARMLIYKFGLDLCIRGTGK